MSAVFLPIGRLFLCTTLLLMTAALQAAPVPWLSYEQADSRESMLRLAKEKSIDWVDPLSHIFLLEDRGQTDQAIHAYEQFITLHASEADSLAIVLPLYWRWMEEQEAFEQRTAFFQNLSDTPRTGMVFQLLFLLEQWLDGLAVYQISKNGSAKLKTVLIAK
ncbi:hypothetical protein [Endozoicomonas arenosclerae]|uniref:hypothetical protein n=1 Tax=Endozoicomonas arenosclerae TaxID=1633495 RepID=UPI000780C4D5|nr:hypothetical protein [Endozoicomonas arenosclerae]